MVDQILAFIFVYPSAPLRNRHTNYIQVAWLATCSAESIPILRTSSNIYIYSCFLDLQNIQHLESVWNPHVFETSSSSRIPQFSKEKTKQIRGPRSCPPTSLAVEKPEKPELPGARLGPGHGKNMGKKNWASRFSIKPHFS